MVLISTKDLFETNVSLESTITCPTQEQLSNSLSDMADIVEPPSSPLGATDSTEDSDEVDDEDSEMDDWELRHPQSFDPHSLCE